MPHRILHRGLQSNRQSGSNVDLTTNTTSGGGNAGQRTAGTGASGAPGTTPSGQPHYPAALPSVLSTKYTGPVTGTAIIDHDYSAIEALVELVTPDATPLTEPLTVEQLHRCAEQMNEACQSALARGAVSNADAEETDSLAGVDDVSDCKRQETQTANPEAYESALERRRRERDELRGDLFLASGNTNLAPNAASDLSHRNDSFTKRSLGGILRRHSRAALDALGGHQHSHRGSLGDVDSEEGKKSRERRSRRLLKEGGFIVFSDEYLRNHPCCPVAAVSQEYQLANPSTTAPPEPDPKLDEKKKKVEDIKRLIYEAESQKRPLFRRRAPELVYGEARYVPRPSNDDATNAQPDTGVSQHREDEDDVYLASSLDSATAAPPSAAPLNEVQEKLTGSIQDAPVNNASRCSSRSSPHGIGASACSRVPASLEPADEAALSLRGLSSS